MFPDFVLNWLCFCDRALALAFYLFLDVAFTVGTRLETKTMLEPLNIENYSITLNHSPHVVIVVSSVKLIVQRHLVLYTETNYDYSSEFGVQHHLVFHNQSQSGIYIT